jgi:hypothetical protein
VSDCFYRLTEAAVAYSWEQLGIRAGISSADTPFENTCRDLGVRFHYGLPEEALFGSPCVVVTPCKPDAWAQLLRSEPESLTWLPTATTLPTGTPLLEDDDAVPIQFWGKGYDGTQPFAELTDDDSLIFHADIVATTAFMLSRWEETAVSAHDEHSRFPATASVAYKQGFLDRPIVDEYALVLREWLKVLLPRWKPKQRSFSVQLSHDVDHVRRFPTLDNATRSIARDLVKRRSLSMACRTVYDLAAQLLSPEYSSYIQGIRWLANLSRKNGLGNDIFYFMADGPGPFGGGYDPASPLVKKCIEDVRRQGFEIGLHASYNSLGDTETLVREKARLEAITGAPVHTVRQHYLRFRAPDTWRHFERAGFASDSTMAYADHEGFRCGTCHPFRPFDIERNCTLDLQEIPLVTVDGTLHVYRGHTPQEAARRVLELARRCQQVEGTFTMLWHNSSLDGEWLPWASMYQQVVQDLGERVS